jgi:hypothetical protein
MSADEDRYFSCETFSNAERAVWVSTRSWRAGLEFAFSIAIRSVWVVFGTPRVTIVERSQLEIEQFLAMLNFENKSRLAKLPGDNNVKDCMRWNILLHNKALQD